MHYHPCLVTFVIIMSSSFLSACATRSPTEHYWDATSPNWQRTLPNSKIKNSSKWGLANDDVDELRKREDHLRWAEMYQKRDEEARRELENK